MTIKHSPVRREMRKQVTMHWGIGLIISSIPGRNYGVERREVIFETDKDFRETKRFE